MIRRAEWSRALGRRVGVRPRLAVLALALAGCPAEAPRAGPVEEAVLPACPPGPLPAAFAPGVDATLERAAPWALPDTRGAVAASTLAAHRAAMAALPGGPGDPWRSGLDSRGALADVALRLASYGAELRGGALVEGQPGAIVTALGWLARAEAVDHGRLVVTPTQLYCAPIEGGLFKPPVDPAFDRNLCTALHPGELVRVFARADAGRWLLVDAGHTLGWVRPGGLTPRITDEQRLGWSAAERVYALRDDVQTVGGVPLRMGVGLPLVARDGDALRVQVAGPDGPREDRLAAGTAVTVGFAPLTRTAVLEAAFAQIGAPYGWGGKDGARDCSQYLRDLLVPFGVSLPRHSSAQAAAGLTTIDVAGLADADKLAAIERAAAQGLVLLYMPGHIMLDVGAEHGRRYAISSIAEFLVPCPGGGGDTVYRLDRVALTDLDTGSGSARGSFLARITTLAVF